MCHVFVLTSAVGCSNCELAWPVIGHGRPYLAKVVYMFIFTLSSAAAGLSKAGLTLKVNACTTSMTDHPKQSMLTMLTNMDGHQLCSVTYCTTCCCCSAMYKNAQISLQLSHIAWPHLYAYFCRTRCMDMQSRGAMTHDADSPFMHAGQSVGNCSCLMCQPCGLSCCPRIHSNRWKPLHTAVPLVLLQHALTAGSPSHVATRMPLQQEHDEQHDQAS